MAKHSKGNAPTPDHSKKGKDKAGFLGPLYTTPDGTGNLGPETVGPPHGGKSAPDPSGYLKHIKQKH